MCGGSMTDRLILAALAGALAHHAISALWRAWQHKIQRDKLDAVIAEQNRAMAKFLGDVLKAQRGEESVEARKN